ncbi:MAG: hypothetical protein WCO43_03560 [Chitinophagia bacterium]|jgi:hypothetical protein
MIQRLSIKIGAMAALRSLVGSEITLIKQHIAGIRQMVPNQIRLTPAERRSMFKLNTKRQDFVHKSLQLMRQHTSSLPALIDVSTCNNDLHLYNQLAEILEELEQLQSKLEDARVFIGNRVMQQTRAFFLHARSAAESGNETYKKVYEDLRPHYAVGRNTPIRLLKKK